MRALRHCLRTPWALAAAVLVLAALAWGGATTWRAAQLPAPTVTADMEADFCVVAPPTPYDPASGLSLIAARTVPTNARCPVCGMYPARSPDWAGQIIFSNGDAQFFDSPVSLLMFLNDVPRYSAGRSGDDIVARYVTDATSKDWIDAGAAFYVYGSNALGPMRAGNLPAFAKRSEAEQFAKQRGGEVRVLGAINAQMLQSMSSRHQHR